MRKYLTMLTESNNLYYADGMANDRAIDDNGTYYSHSQLATWQSASGKGVNDIMANPLLDSDLRPAANSPAIDHGNATICAQYPTDYAGLNQLRYGRGCEIGAYAFPAAGMGGM